MTIPESQLETWSHLGSVTGSANTHASIRDALAAYEWPEGTTYDPYLQGSYRNTTNIRGDSDVDLVVELTSVFWNNLTQDEKDQLGLTSVSYSWDDFRSDVILALEGYYGKKFVDTSGSRSVKLLPGGNRLKADVVVCATYKYYKDLKVYAEGMTFWTRPGRMQIINYPKLHYDNGVKKNSATRTGQSYKPVVRMFKNARNKVIANSPSLGGRFPSYFVECLLYNVPDRKFTSDFQETYTGVVDYLNDELLNGGCGNYVCQNGMYYLFGPSSVQWNQDDAKEMVDQLINLWNNW